MLPRFFTIALVSSLGFSCSAATSSSILPQANPSQNSVETTVAEVIEAGPPEAGPRDAGHAVEAGTTALVPPVITDAESDASRPRCGDGPSEDADGDGFGRKDGDCDDCQKTINPAAYDIPGNGIDEDCDGIAATEAECDQGLSMSSESAEDGARAIGLCKFTDTTSRSWGVVSARYTNASGVGKLPDRRAAGILADFGAAKPRAGKALLSLSSGVARAPGQPEYTSGCDSFGSAFNCTTGSADCAGSTGEPPPGYPKQSSICAAAGRWFPEDPEVYDQAALELKIRVPTNANAFAFDSIFYTYEYPDWICEAFNDFFVVFKEPKPTNVADGNIVFDINHDPIGVNTALLAVCDPSVQLPNAAKTFTCDQGTALLKGTGYGRNESECGTGARPGGASTGWLQTTAPVRPGEVITLRFAVWDTTDALLDSTVLIDHFRWITFEAEPEKEVPIETKPVILL
jgi:hypothetical protein